MLDQRYPEHAKLQEVKDNSQAIGEFLDGCGYTLCEPDPHFLGRFRPVHKPITTILAEWFDINQNTLEREKQEMLQVMREMSLLKDGHA